VVLRQGAKCALTRLRPFGDCPQTRNRYSSCAWPVRLPFQHAITPAHRASAVHMNTSRPCALTIMPLPSRRRNVSPTHTCSNATRCHSPSRQTSAVGVGLLSSSLSNPQTPLMPVILRLRGAHQPTLGEEAARLLTKRCFVKASRQFGFSATLIRVFSHLNAGY
jgi:hypothetical protein